MSKDSILKTFIVAFITCAVCSVFVSSAAVLLKPYQVMNQELFKNKNILMACGLMESGENLSPAEIQERFKKLQVVKFNFTTGEIAATGEDALRYDERTSAKTPGEMVKVDSSQFKPGIATRGKYGTAYYVTDETGKVKTVTIPIVGKGLWSVMYGFIALGGENLNTVERLSFYEQGETAGLGSEIENPEWTGKWQGKLAFNESGVPKIHVVKGAANPESSYEVDGISGATLTCNGVNGTVGYWLSEYQPLLKKLAEGEVKP
ncbi:MAG: Na(+)-translocating NADH-quinone reductase subunit C [Planctomycetia bacterium]|nr:Na(+)-translocating NADH-quinone reductase subunit C [Planctomycetia bacterium]